MYQQFLSIMILVFLQSFGFAQVMGDYSLKVDVNSVFLNMSVREPVSNRSLSGLQKNDFAVFEDGVRQEIQQFLPTEAPFNLLLLLDVSGSTSDYLKMMKQAAIEFAHSLNPDDRVAVATFNSTVRLVEDFTKDREAAERAIRHIRSGGGTAFYDALMTSLGQYLQGIQGRTAIVVFTDGVDNRLEGIPESGSIVGFDELYRRVQETDAIVYTIFLDTEMESRLAQYLGHVPVGPGWPRGRIFGWLFGSPPFSFPLPSAPPNPMPRAYPIPINDGGDAVYKQAREQLKLIADQTGGRMYSPTRIEELSGAYSEIADDLRAQYQLGYNSTNQAHDGKWRNIRIRLEKKPEAVIRTRRGYYVRKEESQPAMAQ